MQNNADLQAAQAKVEESTYDLDFQKKSFFPHLDLSASTAYYDGESLSAFALARGITEELIRSTHISTGYLVASPTVSVPVFKEGAVFGLHAPTINMAANQVLIDKGNYQASKNDTIFSVSSSFFTLLKNTEDIKTAEEHMSSLSLDHKTALSKYKEELISKNELLVAEVRLASGERDLTVYRNLSRTLTADLCMRMGLDPSRSIQISEERWVIPPLPPLDQLITTALANRSEIKAQEARILQAKEEQRRAKNERYPNIDLSSRYGVAYDYESRRNSLWMTTLDLNMPLFDFGAQGAKIDSLNAKVTEAEKGLRSIKGTVTQEVIMAFTNMSNTSSEISLQEKVVQQSQENARVVRGRFQQNLVPLSVLLEAEYAVYDNQKALAQVKYDLRTHYLELVKAVATQLMAISQK